MMKKIVLIAAFMSSSLFAVEPPFSRGVNLAGWFQTASAQQIQFTRYGKQDFINLQKIGCDVVRLPINLHFMTDGAPNYTLDPLCLNFLDQVADWAEELGIHLILDNHTFDPAVNTDPNIGDVLVPVWQQMAEHFKNRSTLIYYEILNEPHGINDALWNDIQGQALAAIRQVDTVHTVIVGPANWNSYGNLSQMPVYDDDKLIYTFHFYDPFLFTHQGASWVDPSMESLSGVPFPYISPLMPRLPASFVGTWLEDAYRNYPDQGNGSFIWSKIDVAVNFAQERSVPIFCGEFGALMDNARDQHRVTWHKYVVDYLTEKKISWALWSFDGGFGIFNKDSNEDWNSDLNEPLLEALGLTPLSQVDTQQGPDSTGFEIYSDYIGANIIESSNAGNGNINFYDTNSPQNGAYCLRWTGAQQYQTVGFDFRPDRDFSRLLAEGFVLDFWLRGDTPGADFQLRFIDTKSGQAGDHPWRMNYPISETIAAFDNQWHHLQIPLSDFQDGGSFDDNTWFPPAGKFDWSAIDRFDLVAESGPLGAAQFWFDDIRIANPNAAAVAVNPPVMSGFQLSQNYPNPFNPSTQFEFVLPQNTFVTIAVFNSMGQTVRTLVRGEKTAGSHRIFWDGRNASGLPAASGVYHYGMWAGDYYQVRSMLLVR